MDIGIKVIGEFEALRLDSCETRDDAHPTTSDQASGRGRISDTTGSQSKHSRHCGCSEQTDSRNPVEELQFSETHYASMPENNERPYRSLEFTHETCINDSGFVSWHHNSVDNLERLTCMGNKGVYPMSNGINEQDGYICRTQNERSKDDESNDEDDEINLESVKNKLMSAWTNTKNGYLIGLTSIYCT